MRVLFVSGIDGFCHRYQVLHRAAQVASRGGSATVRHFADPRLPLEVAAHEVLLLYRVPATVHVRETLDRARALGVPAIGAIDDLIFVDDPALLPPLEHLPHGERERWRHGVRRYHTTLSWCDAVVAPTEPLAGVARSLGWTAYLHRNSVAPAELELARGARAAAPPRAAEDVVLGYFSGTPTHDEDFATIGGPLAAVLEEHPHVRLLVVGPLVLPDGLRRFRARVEQRALVPWHQLPEAMAAADVSLAPLATGRPFAAAKGEIKYLEAGALGIPTVASATSAYRHAIRDGENGRLADGPTAWRAALDALVRDAALRFRLGAAAAADVATRWAEGVRAAELDAILSQVVSGHEPLRQAQSLADRRPRGTFDVERAARHALEADGLAALPERHARAVSPPLADGQRLEQRFRAACDGLFRVDLHTVTYGQDLDHELLLALRRDDGTLVAATRVPAAEAPDRGWLALDLAACERHSGGRVYTLEIAARAAGSGNAVSLGLAPADAGAVPDGGRDGTCGVALLDGEPLAGALALRAFAAWDVALASGAERAAARPNGTVPGGPHARGAASGPLARPHA